MSLEMSLKKCVGQKVPKHPAALNSSQKIVRRRQILHESVIMLWSVCTLVPLLTVVSGVVVNTRYGALRGTRQTIDADSFVDVFYNIPYAKPPVGNETGLC